MDMSNAKTPRRLYLPRATRRLGQQLLTQQCWCWGQDVRCESGNLLLQYGFERHRPPDGESGATTYLLRLLPDRVLALWGFGLWYGECDCGGIFVGRFDFEARFSARETPPLPVWTPHQLADVPVPCDACRRRAARHLLSRAAGWIADYERWILAQRGLEYRRACLENWSQDFIAPEAMAPSWQRVQHDLAARRLPN